MRAARADATARRALLALGGGGGGGDPASCGAGSAAISASESCVVVVAAAALLSLSLSVFRQPTAHSPHPRLAVRRQHPPIDEQRKRLAVELPDEERQRKRGATTTHALAVWIEKQRSAQPAGVGRLVGRSVGRSRPRFDRRANRPVHGAQARFEANERAARSRLKTNRDHSTDAGRLRRALLLDPHC